MWLTAALIGLVERRVDWEAWQNVVEKGVTIDRPRGARHSEYPSIIYPIDYGYLPGTAATDAHGIDVFVGRASTGLVGAIISTDHRKGDTEFKLLHNCSPEEIYLANGFINFDRRLMEGVLVLRWRMEEIWGRAAAPA